MASGSGARAAKALSPEKKEVSKSPSQAERLRGSALAGAAPGGRKPIVKPSQAQGKAKEAMATLTAGGALAQGFAPSAVSGPLALTWSGGDGEWRAASELGEVHVSTRGAGNQVALFLHGADPNRAAASWANYWPSLVDEGMAVIAIDMPGHGQSSASSGKSSAAEGADESGLVIAVLRSFAAPEAAAVTEGGGASALVRAYMAAPKLFGAHHQLLNPVLGPWFDGETPARWKATLEAEGCDVQMLLADSWGEQDAPNRMAMSGKMLKWAFRPEAIPERADCVTLKPLRASCGVAVKAMRPAEWLHGAPSGEADARLFRFAPSAECLSELLAYLTGPRRAAVRPEGEGAAPTRSALELGQENATFRVYVRVRPLLPREKAAGVAECIEVSDVDFPRQPPPQRLAVSDPRLGGGAPAEGTELFEHRAKRGEFVFDRAFCPAAQEELFAQVGQPLVAAVLEGVNATLFAYGQTGTGKTYTMEGPAEEPGLMSRAITALFAALPDSKQVHYHYDSEWLDLLEPAGAAKLSIAEGAAFTYLKGSKLATAATAAALLADVRAGGEFRAHGKTNMNDASSRSHAVLLVMVAERGAPAEGGACLYMIDLAGSERQKRSGVANNAALSALGRVVTSLVEKDGARAAHIGYKDSPLTDLLKCGLGGASQTALVACLTAASDSVDESLNTLRFAVQCSHVKNKVAAKEKKDARSAEAAVIERAANELVLADGAGEVALPTGSIGVRGSWGDASLPTVICLGDSEHPMGWGTEDPAQFDGLTARLAEHARVLCPKLGWGKSDKEPDKWVPQLLALCDWLGLAKPLLYGRDGGAVVALAFKIAHPGRCGALVLENCREHYDEAEFKRRAKKDPSIVMGSIGGPWSLVTPMDSKGGSSQQQMKNLNKFKGKGSYLLWPCQWKGKPVAGQSMMRSLGEMTVKNLKGITMVDTAAWKGDEPLAAQIIQLLK